MKLYDKKNDKITFSKDFFQFLKYNIIKDNVKLNDNDEEYYNEFINKINALEEALEDDNNSLASNILGSVMGMFGFSRHYCSISGQPIIGKYFKINGKPVSKTAYESYKIVQQMEGLVKEDSKKEKKTHAKKYE